MAQQPVVDAARKLYAAQNVREGLINVNDLSSLTGLEVSQLTRLAKTGQITHYGEYHGKRFFNFEELVVWAVTPSEENAEAKATFRHALENEMARPDCPYSIEEVAETGGNAVKLVWKELPQAA